MRRDPKAFRERFNAWKNGLLVYLGGRPTELPGYEGGKNNEEDRFATTEMPELVVTAPRKYILEYDQSGNPVYTTDRTKSMSYEGVRPSESKYQRWANRDKNAPKYTDPIIKAALLGIGLPMIGSASLGGVLAGDVIADLYAHPIANVAGMITGELGRRADEEYKLTNTLSGGRINEGVIGSLLAYPFGRGFVEHGIAPAWKNIKHPSSLITLGNNAPIEEGGNIENYTSNKKPSKFLSSQLVNEKGEVDIRKVVKIIQDLREILPQLFPSSYRDYKQITNSSGNLFDHTNAVVRSAQIAPLPKGYTRKQLVESALLHDIGKTINSTRSHDKSSRSLINLIQERYNLDIDPSVSEAVGHHMSRRIAEKDPLTRALHAVDVARGRDMDEVFSEFPYLYYPTDKPLVNPNLPKDYRWQLENIINPIIDRYGYTLTNAERSKYGLGPYVEGDPQIPLDVDEKTAKQMVLDFVKKHRTFERTSHYPNSSLDNLKQLASEILNKPKDQLTDDDLFNDSAEYIKQRDTHNGTVGLDDYLRTSELDENTNLALYTSTRDETATWYARENSGKPYRMDLVLMNINDDPKWNLAELWANNEFPVPYLNIRRLSDWRKYELPYILNTGKKDYRDIVILPRQKNEDAVSMANMEAMALQDEAVLQQLKLNPPRQIMYRDVPDAPFMSRELSDGEILNIHNMAQNINKMFEEVGLQPISPIIKGNKQLYVKDYGWFLSDVSAVRDFYKSFDLPLDYFYVWDDVLGPEEAPSMFENRKSAYIRNMLSLLKSYKLITNKEYHGTLNQLETEGGDVDKYINKKKLLQRAKDLYFSSLPKTRQRNAYYRTKRVARLQDEENRLLEMHIRDELEPLEKFYEPPQLLPETSPVELLKSVGVEPNYSIESPDGYRIFSTELMLDPDPNTMAGNHYVIVGKRGSKQLNVVGKYDPLQMLAHNSHGGSLILGLSRNFGTLAPFVFGVPYFFNKTHKNYANGKDDDITTLREVIVTPNKSYAMASSDDMYKDLQYNIARAQYKNNLDAYNLLRNMNVAQEGVAMNFGLPLVMGLAGSPIDIGVEGAMNLGKAGLNLLKSRGSVLRQIGANATQDYALAGGGKRFTLMLYDNYLRGYDIPHLHVKPRINKPAPIGTAKAFKNSIEPRLRAMRPWMSENDVKNAVDATLDQGYSVYDKSIFDKAGIEENVAGEYFPSTDHIAVKEGYEKFASNHEFRHRLDNRLPLVEAEESLLSKSFTDDFIKLSEEVEKFNGVDLSLEMNTVNRDAVEELLGTEAYNTVPVRKQKQLIKSASDDEIVTAMENSNGYGRAYVEKLRRKYGKVPKSLINAWRKSYQQVGVGAGVAVLNSKSKK